MYRVQGSHLLKMDWLVSKIDADIGGYIYMYIHLQFLSACLFLTPKPFERKLQ